MDDIQLIKKIRSGHTRSFDRLYTKYSMSLMNYIMRLVQDRHISEDIFHETFIQVIKNINLEFDRAKFSVWLFKVARNLALNHLRKDRMQTFESGMDVFIGKDQPNQRVEAAQVTDKILWKLSAEHREVFLLKQKEGFSYEEIAEILECPIGTIRSRLHYCVKEIKNIAKEYCNEVL